MRVLPPELKTYLDGKVISKPDATPDVVIQQAASACVGITEQGGDNKGKWVELFQSTLSEPSSQSWCMDFVQSCIAYAEVTKGVVSGLAATEGCLDLWNKSSATHQVKKPIKGDIVIYQMGNTEKGHCGIIIGEDGDRWLTIEGNTSPSSEIDRNGDGCYVKKRIKGGSVTFREVGFLRVFS